MGTIVTAFGLTIGWESNTIISLMADHLNSNKCLYQAGIGGDIVPDRGLNWTPVLVVAGQSFLKKFHVISRCHFFVYFKKKNIIDKV